MNKKEKEFESLNGSISVIDCLKKVGSTIRSVGGALYL